MKKKPQAAQALEAELVKLTTLVRARRKELERLKDCPNRACECRRVWKDQVDKTLASQVRKIRRQVGGQRAKASKPKVSAAINASSIHRKSHQVQKNRRSQPALD